MAKQELEAAIDSLKLGMRSEFVPWSKSRAFKPAAKSVTDLSLNWRVTLTRDGRDILTTDYGAGVAHCPSYPKGGRVSVDDDTAIRFECEKGLPAFVGASGTLLTRATRKPILPDTPDVVYSLTLDASVLDAPTFEEWADQFGFDQDSRKAKASYRACLEIALKLRAGIGEDGLALLQEASQDY